MRSGDDAIRAVALAAFAIELPAIAARRNVKFRVETLYDADAAPCDPALQKQFEAAIAARGIKPRYLASGAGHDAMVFPVVAPIAMLFVRCGNNGISHHPDETMTAEDAEIATDVLLHFFENYQPPRHASPLAGEAARRGGEGVGADPSLARSLSTTPSP